MIYLLKRKTPATANECATKIVRAWTTREARKLANEQVGDEGHIWNDPKRVTCKMVNPAGDAEVLGMKFGDPA